MIAFSLYKNVTQLVADIENVISASITQSYASIVYKEDGFVKTAMFPLDETNDFTLTT